MVIFKFQVGPSCSYYSIVQLSFQKHLCILMHVLDVCREQVTVDRPFISLQGEGPDNTMVEYSSGGGIFICTFSVMADNFVAKRISFKVNMKKIWHRVMFIFR